MQESFYRGQTIYIEKRKLPAQVYNQMVLMLKKTAEDAVFVPIRQMQYLAVIDSEEIIFVDRYARRNIEFSWAEFQVKGRTSLKDPVDYQLICYQEKALQTMKRMQSEFATALHQLAQRYNQQQEDAGQNNVFVFPAQ